MRDITYTSKNSTPLEPGLRHLCLAKCDCTWHLIINSEKEVLYCSPICEDITGYPPELFLQNHGYIESIIHPADKDRCPTQFAGDTNENNPRKNEYRIFTRTGDVKWIASYIKPILLEDEDHACTLISNLDITPYRERIFRLEKENDTICRRNKELVKELSYAFYDIGNSESQIVAHNRELKKTNQELREANNALKVLAKNLDKVKRDTENSLHNSIIKNIYPLMEELKNMRGQSSFSMLTENLLFRIDELCQSLGSDHSAYFGKYLSATEIKVAVFIKEGLISSEIARQLSISVATVKTHRKNIRRKLKIQNSKINLSSYLKLKWHHRD